MIRQYPIKQEFKNYTEEDFFVWKTLFSRQTSLLKDKVYSKFFDYLNMLNINENEIPNIYLLSKIIEEKTGWQLQIVPSIVPIKQFLCMLEQKIFPTTCWLRQKHEIDYIEEPDMFHDVFGHVPFLLDENLTNLYYLIGKYGLEHMHDPYKLNIIENIYWYGIEFSSIFENNNLKIIGSGIISSKSEVENFYNQTIYKNFNRFDFYSDKIINKSKIQNEYYFINSKTKQTLENYLNFL